MEKHFTTTTEAIEALKQDNYKITSIEQTENSIMLNEYTVNKNEKLAIVFGNEVKGVEQEVINNSDVVIEIPQWH